MSTSKQPAALSTRSALDKENASLESFIEDLKLQVSAANTTQRLQPTKSILLSILQTIRPDSNRIEERDFSFIKRLVELSMNIFLLIETSEVIPRSTLGEFNHVLEDVETFLVSANRWKSYPCSPTALEQVINTKYRAFDQRLATIIDSLEAAAATAGTLPSETSATRPSTNASSIFFPDAHDFTIKQCQFYSAPGGNIIFMNGTDKLQGVARNSDQYEDIELEKELYKSREYRLHRGRARGRAVLVKVFQGPRAKQLCWKTARLNCRVMHSNLLRMVAGPNQNFETSFIVFDGDYQGVVESLLAGDLRDGVKEACVKGANTVVACSLGLNYLQEIGFPFTNMAPEHFVLMVTKDGRVVINFDTDLTWDAARNDLDDLGPGQTEKVIEVFDGLIQKTFYTSCKEYYRNQRFYDESDELLGGDDDNLHEPEDVAGQSFAGSEDTVKEVNASGQNSPHKAKVHRRELIWKSRTASSASLEEIGQNYQASLGDFVLNLFWSTVKVILLNRPRIGVQDTSAPRSYFPLFFEQSWIVSHTSPVPDEICFVCRQTVEKADLFDCSCGLPLNNDVNVTLPTVRCTLCFLWQHQTCANVSTETQSKAFICWRCLGNRITVPVMNLEGNATAILLSTSSEDVSPSTRLTNQAESPAIYQGKGKTTQSPTTAMSYNSKLDAPATSHVSEVDVNYWKKTFIDLRFGTNTDPTTCDINGNIARESPLFTEEHHTEYHQQQGRQQFPISHSQKEHWHSSIETATDEELKEPHRDVMTIRELLTNHFGYRPEYITILSNNDVCAA